MDGLGIVVEFRRPDFGILHDTDFIGQRIGAAMRANLLAMDSGSMVFCS